MGLVEITSGLVNANFSLPEWQAVKMIVFAPFIRTAGVQFMRDNPERFIESNTENSWLRYLNNMCIQGTWADALIIQAVADALNVTLNSRI